MVYSIGHKYGFTGRGGGSGAGKSGTDAATATAAGAAAALTNDATPASGIARAAAVAVDHRGDGNDGREPSTGDGAGAGSRARGPVGVVGGALGWMNGLGEKVKFARWAGADGITPISSGENPSTGGLDANNANTGGPKP